MRISQWAGLHNRQAELDFVDIDTDADLPLFLDPFAIDIRRDTWSDECGKHLRSFFNALIFALRNNEYARAEHLASHLHEASETFLGLSAGRPQGRGIGRGQALELINALKKSRAVQTGILEELGEAELFIDGIGSDKVSDLTTNIIRGPLLRYTAEQADLWGMALTDGVALGSIWDPVSEDWIQGYQRTIVVHGVPVILVPKFSVRRKLALDSQEFYNNYMINFLQQEYAKSGQSLVRVLKSGERRVYKKDVKEKHPKSKAALADFVHQHPEVLEQYKRISGAKGPLEAEEFEQTFDERDYADKLITTLRAIPPGGDNASLYHSYCIGVLTFIFYPILISPVKEREIDQGRKRIDISYKNAAREGMFETALKSSQMRSIEIPVECKNYSRDIANPELDQIGGRFSFTRGFLGMLCCRKLDDKNRFVDRCRDASSSRGHYILLFDDDDLIELLGNIKNGKRHLNDMAMRSKLSRIMS